MCSAEGSGDVGGGVEGEVGLGEVLVAVFAGGGGAAGGGEEGVSSAGGGGFGGAFGG